MKFKTWGRRTLLKVYRIEEESPESTEQYRFAESVTRAKVIVEIYDGHPYSDNQIVRARRAADGAEYGHETYIRPFERLTVGQALDISLRKLLETTSNATNPREPEEETRAEA